MTSHGENADNATDPRSEEPRLQTVGIVGASLAGLRMVEALRTTGHIGHITVIGDEKAMPYNRPPLSKKILTGETAAQEVALPIADNVETVEWVLDTPVVALDVSACAVTLTTGAHRSFDTIVLATGAAARTLPIAERPDGPLPGVHTLRSLQDAEDLRVSLDHGGAVVVVGAGLVGCEIASSCIARGQRVVVIDSAAGAMERVLPPVLARRMEGIHQTAGVEFRFGVTLDRVEGDGRVEAVHLSDGTIVEASTVVIAVGSVPNTGWLDGSGLDIIDGVLTDGWCRAVGGRGRVYAIGDVCRRDDGRRSPVREEHWSSAAEHADIVARCMLEGDAGPEPDPIPFFWSEQVGHKIQVIGRPSEGTEVIERIGETPAAVSLEFLRDGRVVAAAAIDGPGRIAAARRNLLERARTAETAA